MSVATTPARSFMAVSTGSWHESRTGNFLMFVCVTANTSPARANGLTS